MKTTKKCQGTGVAKGHGCKKDVPVSLFNKANRIYGLGMSCGCYSSWLFNTPEGQEIISKATIKATAPRKELESATAEAKQKTSIKYLLINVKNSVHRYIRERDKYKECISCGCRWNSDFQAGHYYKAELYSQIKFDFQNIHGQCPQCNIFNEGNINEYSLRLPKRIGQHEYDMLKSRADACKLDSLFKFDRKSLEEIRDEANFFFNELKKV